jgi:VanZ family protein
MVIIFSASSDVKSYEHSSSLFVPLMHWLFPRMSPEHVDAIHYLFRKVCHLTEYALLALLLWRAIRQPKRYDPRPWLWPEAGLALAIVFLYSASDELHQVFVPTRTGMVSDVFIDAGGGTIGLLLLWVIGKLFKRW